MDLVNRYASALSLHPTPVEAVGEVAGEILEQFEGARPDLLVCFASPHHAGAFEDVMGGLRKLLEPETAIGATMVGVAGGGVEVEDGPGLSVLAASFGAGRIDPDRARRPARPTTATRSSGWPDSVPGARHHADARRSVLVSRSAISWRCATSGSRASR